MSSNKYFFLVDVIIFVMRSVSMNVQGHDWPLLLKFNTLCRERGSNCYKSSCVEVKHPISLPVCS